MSMHDVDYVPDTGSLDGAWYAKIAVGAADMDDLVSVVIPAFDPNFRFERCRWQARNSTDRPIRNDECLVIFDDRRQPWVVSWWPF